MFYTSKTTLPNWACSLNLSSHLEPESLISFQESIYLQILHLEIG